MSNSVEQPMYAFSMVETCMSWQPNTVRDTIPAAHTQLAVHHVTPEGPPSALRDLEIERPAPKNETMCCNGLTCKYLDGVCCPGSTHCCARGYLCNTDTNPPTCEDDLQDPNARRMKKTHVTDVKIWDHNGNQIAGKVDAKKDSETSAEAKQSDDASINSSSQENSELDASGANKDGSSDGKNATKNTDEESADMDAEKRSVRIVVDGNEHLFL